MKIRKLAYATFVGLAGCIRNWFGCAQRSSQEEEGSGCGAGSAGAAVADVLGSALCTSLRDQGQPEFQLHQCLLCHERWRL